MGVIATAIRHMFKAGMNEDQIIEAIEEMEATAAPIRTARQERNRRYYEKKSSEKRLKASNSDNSDTSVLNKTLSRGHTRGEDNLQTKKISGQEEKKDTSPPARSKRGERIPDDFQPDIQSAISEGLSRQEAERQARSFCDYWRAKPGKDGLKLDWPATWRVWYRRHLSSSPPPSRHSADPPHRMDRVNAILDEIQGKSHVPQHTGPSIDGSVERTDRGGAPNLVQLHAVSAWGRS